MTVSSLLHGGLMRVVTPRRLRYLRLVKSREGWGPDQIRAYQEQRLRQLIPYCWQHVPFYREHWRGYLSDPADVRTLEDLAELPPVSRAQFREHAPEFVTADASVKSAEARTGGSTAAPIVYRTTREDDELAWAQLYAGWT